MIRSLRRHHLAGAAALALGPMVLALTSRSQPGSTRSGTAEPPPLQAVDGPVPDPLLYRVDRVPLDSTALPPNARFLGPVGPGHQPLGRSDSIETAVLLLWSHGWRRVVATAPATSRGAP